MKATLWSHLDCQGGLPQNTLARSTFKNLDCQGGQPAEYLGQEQGYVEYAVLLSRPSKDGFARLDGRLRKNARLTPVFLRFSPHSVRH